MSPSRIHILPRGVTPFQSNLHSFPAEVLPVPVHASDRLLPAASHGRPGDRSVRVRGAGPAATAPARRAGPSVAAGASSSWSLRWWVSFSLIPFRAFLFAFDFYKSDQHVRVREIDLGKTLDKHVIFSGCLSGCGHLWPPAWSVSWPPAARELKPGHQEASWGFLEK